MSSLSYCYLPISPTLMLVRFSDGVILTVQTKSNPATDALDFVAQLVAVASSVRLTPAMTWAGCENPRANGGCSNRPRVACAAPRRSAMHTPAASCRSPTARLLRYVQTYMIEELRSFRLSLVRNGAAFMLEAVR